MIDQIDIAQSVEEQDRARALAATRARIGVALAPRDASIDGRCIECEEPIEPARLAALRGCTSRCAQCAKDHETRMRMGR